MQIMTNYNVDVNTIDCNMTQTSPTLLTRRYHKNYIFKKYFFVWTSYKSQTRNISEVFFLRRTGRLVNPSLLQLRWRGIWSHQPRPRLVGGGCVVCGRWEGSGKYVSLQDTRTRPEGRATARHPPKQYRQGCLIKGENGFLATSEVVC